jgi:dGTPase
VIRAVEEHGESEWPADEAAALAALAAFNYERIYVRPASLAQSVRSSRCFAHLVEYYSEHPEQIPDELQIERRSERSRTRRCDIRGGMTDRYAFDMASVTSDWSPERLPRGIDRGLNSYLAA